MHPPPQSLRPTVPAPLRLKRLLRQHCPRKDLILQKKRLPEQRLQKRPRWERHRLLLPEQSLFRRRFPQSETQCFRYNRRLVLPVTRQPGYHIPHLRQIRLPPNCFRYMAQGCQLFPERRKMCRLSVRSRYRPFLPSGLFSFFSSSFFSFFLYILNIG